ncbi:carbohydrate ABC transporter permease [Paenibacillus alkalitolerans]|uniref:carbohydrate ABC transporter permease n=1 Tax=Paenibacillus alkalitolerans TaxID=2799335 RepID=UPI002D800AA9|nr:sugar ABC transporter permease [Paenibacillus alkalitolerans]
MDKTVLAIDKKTPSLQKRKTKSFVWQEIKKNTDSYLMIAPFGLIFTFFMIIPVASSMVLSFTYFNMLQPPKWVGLENYMRLFLDDEVFLIAAKNTLTFAFITGPTSYIACLFFAWFVNELSPKIRAVITFLLYIPSISGNVFVVWTYIFSGDQYGLINGWLLKNELLLEPIQWLTDTKYMLGVIIVVQLWLGLGAAFLSFIAGLQGIDRQLYEASAIDGVRNRWQELWYVTLPSMGPQLMFGAVMQIGASFAIGGIANSLVGFPSTDYAAHTVATHMQDVGTVRFEMGYASAIAVVLFATMILFNTAIRKILSKFSD